MRPHGVLTARAPGSPAQRRGAFVDVRSHLRRRLDRRIAKPKAWLRKPGPGGRGGRQPVQARRPRGAGGGRRPPAGGRPSPGCPGARAGSRRAAGGAGSSASRTTPLSVASGSRDRSGLDRRRRPVEPQRELRAQVHSPARVVTVSSAGAAHARCSHPKGFQVKPWLHSECSAASMPRHSRTRATAHRPRSARPFIRFAPSSCTDMRRRTALPPRDARRQSLDISCHSTVGIAACPRMPSPRGPASRAGPRSWPGPSPTCSPTWPRPAPTRTRSGASPGFAARTSTIPTSACPIPQRARPGASPPRSQATTTSASTWRKPCPRERWTSSSTPSAQAPRSSGRSRRWSATDASSTTGPRPTSCARVTPSSSPSAPRAESPCSGRGSSSRSRPPCVWPGKRPPRRSAPSRCTSPIGRPRTSSSSASSSGRPCGSSRRRTGC